MTANTTPTMNTTTAPSRDEAPLDSPISFTKSAASYISEFLLKNKTALGLRVGVKKSGCSGLKYVVDCAMNIAESDKVYEEEGIQIIVDEKHLPYLKGMVINCVTQGLNQMLMFENPNATGACGCGESFSIE